MQSPPRPSTLAGALLQVARSVNIVSALARLTQLGFFPAAADHGEAYATLPWTLAGTLICNC